MRQTAGQGDRGEGDGNDHVHHVLPFFFCAEEDDASLADHERLPHLPPQVVFASYSNMPSMGQALPQVLPQLCHNHAHKRT